MKSVKALLLLDMGGNCLTNYLSVNNDKSNLITGLINAINSLVSELFGGSIRKLLLNNGLVMRSDRIYFKRLINQVMLSYTNGIDFNWSVKLEGDHYIVCDNGESLGKLIKSLGYNVTNLRIIDGVNNYLIKYVPVINYAVTNDKTDLFIDYLLIHDSKDEELNGFMKEEVNKLVRLISDNSNLFGPALINGDVSYLTPFKDKLIGFVNDYELRRSELLIDPDYITPKFNVDYESIKSIYDALRLIKKQLGMN